MPQTDLRRREFLALSAGTCLTLAGCRSSSPESAGAPREVDVVIVGAGFAGLGAAADLRRDGFDVVVLEGRDRVGGRVFTDRRWDDLPVDLGASWIHGRNGNPLTELAEQQGVETKVFDVGGAEGDGTYATYDVDGEPVGEAAAARLESDLDDLYDATERSASGRDGRELSVTEALERALTELELDALRADELRLSVTLLAEDYGSTPDRLALSSLLEGDEYPGPHLVIPGGFDQLARNLARGTRILRGATVSSIEHSRRGVTVRSTKGDFKARHVVVTPSLGVLKSGAIDFRPMLPAGHRDSLERLAIGRFEKLVLRFDEAFWDDVDVIEHRTEPGRPFSAFYNIDRVAGVPALMALNGGDSANSLANKSNAERAEIAMRALREIYGGDVMQLRAARSTDWARDPFALGSYSYTPVGAGADDRRALGEAIDERVWIAGEAVHPTRHSTVHGALLSGRQAAKEIAEL